MSSIRDFSKDVNGHDELVHASPTISVGGWVSGTSNRQHARFLSVVPDSRYLTMREVMLRFADDAVLLEKAEQASKCKRNADARRQRKKRVAAQEKCEHTYIRINPAADVERCACGKFRFVSGNTF